MHINSKTVYLALIFALVCSLLAACGTGGVTPTTFDSPTRPSVTFDSPVSPVVTPARTPTVAAEPAAGLSQEDLAPLGTTVAAGDGLRITILEVQRDAEEELIRMDPFNSAGPDEEMVLVRARAELPEPPPSPFTLIPLDFDILDESDTIYPYPLNVIVRGELVARFARAATVEGLLAFRIPRGRDELFLRYYPKDRGGESYEPRWFALQ
jgi:hypothetical protein